MTGPDQDTAPTGDLLDLVAGDNAVSIDLGLGNLAGLRLSGIAPLHRAPWLDEPGIQADETIPLVDRRLSGDFFCLPFGGNDVEPGPPHGWTVNSPWQVEEQGPSSARLVLGRRVFGAIVEKTVSLSAEAPLLYQRHRIIGGQGGVTFAHHPMIRFSAEARFFTSPKREVITAQTPLEPGRNRLAPAICDNLTAVPAADGGTVDLTRLPIGTAHEDFVSLIEADGREIGWTAVMRGAEDDIVFILKNARLMPMTMLWHSNAGRDYAPWNGRHRNVLGVEDGCAAGELGHAAALGPSIYSNAGLRTAVQLGGIIDLPLVIGAIRRPHGWDEVSDIRVAGNRLILEGPEGRTEEMPFEAGFLGAS